MKFIAIYQLPSLHHLGYKPTDNICHIAFEAAKVSIKPGAEIGADDAETLLNMAARLISGPSTPGPDSEPDHAFSRIVAVFAEGRPKAVVDARSAPIRVSRARVDAGVRLAVA